MRINALGNTATDFASDDYIAIDGTTNGSRKMAKSKLLELATNEAIVGNVAEIFDSSRDASNPYLVNEFTLYGGKLYRFDTNHYGAWNASHVHRVEVEEFLQCFSENSVAEQNFYQSATKAYYIKMDYNVGDSVAFTYVSAGGWACLVLSCKKGDVFKVDGTGGSASRLWGFVDSNNKLVEVSAASKTESGTEHVAPCDGKFVYNTNTGGTPYCKKVVSLQKIYSDYQETTYKKDLFADNAQVSKYITTNVGVGNVVNLTPSSSTSFSCIVLDCNEGDSFFIRGAGGSASRLWCFVDSSNKVVSVAGIGEVTGASGKMFVAPCDGKFIFNTEKAYAGGTPYCKVFSSIGEYVELNFENIYKMIGDLDGTLIFKDVPESEIVEKYYIATNVGVGNVVNLTPVSNSTFCYVEKNCNKGDLFEIRGSGGSTPRLWCFIDSSNKIVSVAGENEATGASFLRLEAPVDGKLIYNSGINYTYKNFRTLYDSQEYIDEKFDVSNNRINVLEKYDIPNDPTPFDQLETLLASLDLSLDTRMEQIYSLFDDLVTNYPTLIEKFDAADLVSLSYPRYANGVSSGDPDYLETQAYKTYIYKISNTNEAAGNLSAFPKKKLLIIGAVHGNEYFASVNCYSLAAHLLQNITSDLFSILALFDIWIMPCVNGYGIIHQQRPNANNIDINRNFGTSKWTESGDIDLGTWSGDTANSEFEVQLIEGLKTYIEPDFYVDHHCTPAHSKAQFYSETPSKNVLARSYDSLVQISNFFIKNFPTYFGNSYHLFRDAVYAAALPYGIAIQQGHSDMWFYEQGIEAASIEIFGYINYTGGVYDASGHRGMDLWKISEFTLRNQLAKYLPIVLT